MAGNREGGLKAAFRNKLRDPDYYKKIGAQSWKDPERSRETGFALNPELAKVAGAKGGKKTKNEYAEKKNTNETDRVQAVCLCGKKVCIEDLSSQEEILAILAEAKEDSTGPL